MGDINIKNQLAILGTLLVGSVVIVWLLNNGIITESDLIWFDSFMNRFIRLPFVLLVGTFFFTLFYCEGMVYKGVSKDGRDRIQKVE